MTSVSIPDGVTTIGNGAFSYCSRLTSIYFTGNVPSFGTHAFRSITATAYYPKNNSTWTEDVIQNYGGTITWVAYDVNGTDNPCLNGHDFSGNAEYCKNNCGTKNPDYVEPEQSENPFTDVSKENYFFDAVIWAVENGITSGTSATTFAPHKVCSRAEMVTFLWRAAGNPEPISNKNPFADVTETDYFYKAFPTGRFKITYRT